MDSSASAKDEIWFLRMCHHISNALYTQWKAELFSVYLQKELTYNICVDIKPAAGRKSTQRPGRRAGKKISELQMQCSIYEWIILQTAEEN